MMADRETPMNDKPPVTTSWSDAIILGAAVLGILTGLSFLSFEVAAATGVLALGFVVYKLVTT